MKQIIFALILVLPFSCRLGNIEFPDEQMPVFIVTAESGKPVYVFVSETLRADDANLPLTDTLRTEISMYKNNLFLENLITKDSLYFYYAGDSTAIFNNGLAYTSDHFIEQEQSYSFKITYKDYSPVTIAGEIPPKVEIDSFSFIPNIGYAHDNYFIKHHLVVYFNAPVDETIHYFLSYKIDYSSSILYDRSGPLLIKDDKIQRGKLNSIDLEALSTAEKGDFMLTVYLTSINSGYYHDLVNESNFNEYYENAAFFDLPVYRNPYSMVEGAIANVKAYSVSTPDSTGLIHIVEP